MSRPTSENYLASAMEVLNGVTVYKANGERETRSAPAQDVEEFIAEKGKSVINYNNDSCHTFIHEKDLRAWMAGHARVPVELLRKRFESPNTIDQCEAEAEFLALLNASKEPS